MVEEQELEHALLRLAGRLGHGEDLLAVGDCDEARRLQAGAPGPDTSTRHIRHIPTGFIRGW